MVPNVLNGTIFAGVPLGVPNECQRPSATVGEGATTSQKVGWVQRRGGLGGAIPGKSLLDPVPSPAIKRRLFRVCGSLGAILRRSGKLLKLG